MFNLNVKHKIEWNFESIPHNLSSLFPIDIRNNFDFRFDLQLNPKQAKNSSAALLGSHDDFVFYPMWQWQPGYNTSTPLTLTPTSLLAHALTLSSCSLRLCECSKQLPSALFQLTLAPFVVNNKNNWQGENVCVCVHVCVYILYIFVSVLRAHSACVSLAKQLVNH